MTSQSPEPPDPDLDDLLRGPGFTVVLRGYDRGPVDDLLELARQALAADRPDLRAAAVQALREPLPVRLRGYDRAQVDSHLARVAQLLAR
jgi:DivIVA domain-containing protein